MNPHILLVEDNDDDRYFSQRALAKAGLKSVFHVGDGQAAIDYLSGQKAYADRTKFPLPDIVFLDLKIPEINGHQVLEWIRTQPSLDRCLVYILSSSGEASDRARAAAANVTDYFVKPLTAGNIALILERLKGPASSTNED